jgi:hypothetical protein
LASGIEHAAAVPLARHHRSGGYPTGSRDAWAPPVSPSMV